MGNKNCCGNSEENIDKEMKLQSNHGSFLNRDGNFSLMQHNTSFKGSNVENNPNRNAKYLSKLAKIVEDNQCAILKLKLISSTSLPKNLVLTINAQGLDSSLRNAKDGVTYFGCKKKGEKEKESEKAEIINDFIIPSQDKEIAKRHRGRHFQIEFDLVSTSYKLKDLGIGFGAFCKLDTPLVLKDNHLINIGLVFIVINLSYGQTDSESNTKNDRNHVILEVPNLKLKLFGGPCTGEIHVFEPNCERITIGRLSTNTIVLDDNLLSKNQCFIEYKPESGWILVDGNDKPSTNGSWVYLGEEQTIYKGMVFKANQTLFQASFS